MSLFKIWILLIIGNGRPTPTCPLCDQVCMIPDGGSDSLPNNLHALHIVKLKQALTERDKTITEHENTITYLSSTHTKLNNILENGQKVFVHCVCGHSYRMSLMKKLRLRQQQFIRWRPNTLQVWSVWPFHLIAGGQLILDTFSNHFKCSKREVAEYRHAPAMLRFSPAAPMETSLYRVVMMAYSAYLTFVIASLVCKCLSELSLYLLSIITSSLLFCLKEYRVQGSRWCLRDRSGSSQMDDLIRSALS